MTTHTTKSRTKNITVGLALLAFFGIASAQGAIGTAGAMSEALGGSVGPITINNPGSTTPSEQTIRHKGAGQFAAPTAPTTFGAVGNAAGCPVLEGGSVGVFVANGSKTTARELPGCMSILLAQVLSNIQPAADGSITFREKAMIESLCDFPQYRARLKTVGYRFGGAAWMCAEDRAETPRDDRARLGTPAGFEGANMQDPAVRARAGLPPL